MQVSGKVLVLSTFAIGLAMAGGAWWYNLQQSRLTAQFWGRRDAALLVGAPKVEFLEFGDLFDPAEEPAEETADEEVAAQPADEHHEPVAGRVVVRVVDVTNKPGLVHLRHALTYDGNFDWPEQKTEPLVGDADWKYAIRFMKASDELVVLFTDDFALLGRLETPERDASVAAVPCPRLGPVFLSYLSMKDVGALPAAEK